MSIYGNPVFLIIHVYASENKNIIYVMQQLIETIQIKEIPCTESPRQLLLQADPSEEKISEYLALSRCFVATVSEVPLGTYVVQATAPGVYELMNISVSPAHQRKGIGTKLLRHAIALIAKTGSRRLEVGTGTFGYQLAYYQREGFRVSAIEKNFFTDNYPEPICENGIQLKDMLRLVLEYQ